MQKFYSRCSLKKDRLTSNGIFAYEKRCVFINGAEQLSAAEKDVLANDAERAEKQFDQQRRSLDVIKKVDQAERVLDEITSKSEFAILKDHRHKSLFLGILLARNDNQKLRNENLATLHYDNMKGILSNNDIWDAKQAQKERKQYFENEIRIAKSTFESQKKKQNSDQLNTIKAYWKGKSNHSLQPAINFVQETDNKITNYSASIQRLSDNEKVLEGSLNDVKKQRLAVQNQIKQYENGFAPSNTEPEKQREHIKQIITYLQSQEQTLKSAQTVYENQIQIVKVDNLNDKKMFESEFIVTEGKSLRDIEQIMRNNVELMAKLYIKSDAMVQTMEKDMLAHLEGDSNELAEAFRQTLMAACIEFGPKHVESLYKSRKLETILYLVKADKETQQNYLDISKEYEAAKHIDEQNFTFEEVEQSKHNLEQDVSYALNQLNYLKENKAQTYLNQVLQINQKTNAAGSTLTFDAINSWILQYKRTLEDKKSVSFYRELNNYNVQQDASTQIDNVESLKAQKLLLLSSQKMVREMQKVMNDALQNQAAYSLAPANSPANIFAKTRDDVLNANLIDLADRSVEVRLRKTTHINLQQGVWNRYLESGFKEGELKGDLVALRNRPDLASKYLDNWLPESAMKPYIISALKLTDNDIDSERDPQKRDKLIMARRHGFEVLNQVTRYLQDRSKEADRNHQRHEQEINGILDKTIGARIVDMAEQIWNHDSITVKLAAIGVGLYALKKIFKSTVGKMAMAAIGADYIVDAVTGRGIFDRAGVMTLAERISGTNVQAFLTETELTGKEHHKALHHMLHPDNKTTVQTMHEEWLRTKDGAMIDFDKIGVDPSDIIDGGDDSELQASNTIKKILTKLFKYHGENYDKKTAEEGANSFVETFGAKTTFSDAFHDAVTFKSRGDERETAHGLINKAFEATAIGVEYVYNSTWDTITNHIPWLKDRFRNTKDYLVQQGVPATVEHAKDLADFIARYSGEIFEKAGEGLEWAMDVGADTLFQAKEYKEILLIRWGLYKRQRLTLENGIWETYDTPQKRQYLFKQKFPFDKNTTEALARTSFEQDYIGEITQDNVQAYNKKSGSFETIQTNVNQEMFVMGEASPSDVPNLSHRAGPEYTRSLVREIAKQKARTQLITHLKNKANTITVLNRNRSSGEPYIQNISNTLTLYDVLKSHTQLHQRLFKGNAPSNVDVNKVIELLVTDSELCHFAADVTTEGSNQVRMFMRLILPGSTDYDAIINNQPRISWVEKQQSEPFTGSSFELLQSFDKQKESETFFQLKSKALELVGSKNATPMQYLKEQLGLLRESDLHVFCKEFVDSFYAGKGLTQDQVLEKIMADSSTDFFKEQIQKLNTSQNKDIWTNQLIDQKFDEIYGKNGVDKESRLIIKSILIEQDSIKTTFDVILNAAPARAHLPLKIKAIRGKSINAKWEAYGDKVSEVKALASRVEKNYIKQLVNGFIDSNLPKDSYETVEMESNRKFLEKVYKGEYIYSYETAKIEFNVFLSEVQKSLNLSQTLIDQIKEKIKKTLNKAHKVMYMEKIKCAVLNNKLNEETTGFDDIQFGVNPEIIDAKIQNTTTKEQGKKHFGNKGFSKLFRALSDENEAIMQKDLKDRVEYFINEKIASYKAQMDAAQAKNKKLETLSPDEDLALSYKEYVYSRVFETIMRMRLYDDGLISNSHSHGGVAWKSKGYDLGFISGRLIEQSEIDNFDQHLRSFGQVMSYSTFEKMYKEKTP